MSCHPIAQASGRPISIMSLASPECTHSFRVSCHRMSSDERGLLLPAFARSFRDAALSNGHL
jgi:hypothetical protein